MDVIVTLAPSSERAVVGRLLELNAYDFSRIDRRPIGADGRYGYRYLDAYWSEPQRFPYLITVGGEIGGLVLVTRFDTVWHVCEFLILPKFRRAGVGKAAARQVFDRHPGDWLVRQVAGNDGATAFWRGVILGEPVERVDADGSVIQTFST